MTACTVQGMARVRSGQACPCPVVSDRSVRRGPGVKRDFACTCTRHLCLCSLPCGHSHAGGADTDTQRAIPGSDPSQDSETVRSASSPPGRRCPGCARRTDSAQPSELPGTAQGPAAPADGGLSAMELLAPPY